MAEKDEQTPEERQELAEDQAEESMTEAAEAEEKRAKDRARAAKAKRNLSDQPPLQKESSKGDTTYSVERLIREGSAFLGHPPHVVAGALHGVTKEYISVADAERKIKTFLGG